jgi:branched-chain amino acid transport system substrate-binding protein
MKNKRMLRVLCALFAFALLAAACGDSDEDSAGTTAEGTEGTDGDGGDGDGGDGDGGNVFEGECPTGRALIPAGDPAPEAPTKEVDKTASVGGDGVLDIGTLLPETGSLAFLGPPEFAGVDLAVADINDAGGVLGSDVTLSHGDSGDTSTQTAQEETTRLLNEGVDAIIGAASSGSSLTVIDQITGAGVIQFSPANTSPTFTDYDDGGLYFRTAPSDVLQGRVLADVVAGDGFSNVGILTRDDDYGVNLRDKFTEFFEGSGGTVAASVTYPDTAENFDAQVDEIVGATPDAVVIIGFAETATILKTMVEKGAGPNDIPVYGVDGNMGNALGGELDDPSAVACMVGTIPLTELSSDFQDRLLEVDPDLIDFSYGAEAYDATIIIALAAAIADTDDGVAVAAEINGVTKDGEKCTDFAACKELIEAGTDIDYDGVGGSYEFSDAGEPTAAVFAIPQMDAGGQMRIETYQEASL